MRSYDSSRRREQARRSRSSMLAAARELFLRDGYGATTVAAIAGAANVSVDAVYKAFGNKPGLVRAIHAEALTGEGPVPAEQRSDELRADEADPTTVLRGWGTLTAEVAPRVAPILLLIRAAAASEPELGRLRDELDRARLDRMRVNAQRLVDRGELRAGVSADRAGEVLWTYSSPELYELLVVRQGWSSVDFGRFVGDALVAALLPRPR